MDFILFLRQFRIGPYTIFDTAISYIGIILLSPLLTKLTAKLHLNISRTDWLWLVLPISVIFHAIFGQNTPLMKRLFNPESYYIELIALIFMLYMGIKHIKTPIRK